MLSEEWKELPSDERWVVVGFGGIGLLTVAQTYGYWQLPAAVAFTVVALVAGVVIAVTGGKSDRRLTSRADVRSSRRFLLAFLAIAAVQGGVALASGHCWVGAAWFVFAVILGFGSTRLSRRSSEDAID